MKGPVATPYDLGEDGDRKTRHQPRTRETQLQEKRQTTDKNTESQESHHDPDSLARASRLGGFKETDGASKEPLIVDHTQAHTGRGSGALFGRHPHGQKAGQ